MSAMPEPEPPLPSGIWWFAWSFVVGQVLELGRRGPQSEDAWLPSAVLGIVLVTFVSHGVLRARWVRFWVVVLLVALSVAFELGGLVDEPSGWAAAALALSLVQAVLLHRYTRSAWFSHQRQRQRDANGHSLAPILLVAALVGALGGVLGAEQGMAPTQNIYEDPFSDPFTDPNDPFSGLQ